MKLKINNNYTAIMIVTLVGLVFIVGLCQARSNYIKKVDLDFGVFPGAELSSVKDHNKTVICKVLLSQRNVKDIGKYDLFDPNSPFEGNLCTHLILSWFNIDDTYNIVPDANIDLLNKTSILKFKFPHLKILIEIAITHLGNDRLKLMTTKFIEILTASVKHHFKFINNMKRLVKDNNYDGLHIGPQFYYFSSDKTNFKSFVTNLRDEFHVEGLILSTEVECGTRADIPRLYENLAEVNNILDFVIVRTYNYHKEYNGLLGHQTALYPNSNNDQEESIYGILQFLLTEMRVEPQSLVLSYRLLGCEQRLLNFTNTDVSFWINSEGQVNTNLYYFEICSAVVEAKDDSEMYWDDEAKLPFIRSLVKRWFSFDNSRSIYEKTKFAANFGLSGIMFRSTHMDDFLKLCSNTTNPIHKTANFALKTNDANSETYCSLFTPEVLAVQNKPTVSTNYYVMSVRINASAEISCTAYGNPLPDIFIEKDKEKKLKGIMVQTFPPNNANKNCISERKKVVTMTWKKMGFGELGKYSCIASNALGAATANFFIRNRDKPFVVSDNEIWIEETSVQFTVSAAIRQRAISLPQKVVICQTNVHNSQDNEDGIKMFQEFNGNFCSHLLPINFLFESNHSHNYLGEMLKSITQKFPHLKLLLPLSHGNQEYLKRKARTEDKSLKFAKIIRNIIIKTGFHGLYIGDLEISFNWYMANIALAKELKTEFEIDGLQLVKEIKLHLDVDSGKIFSLESVAGMSNLYFDMIVIKGFDFHKSNYSTASHNAPMDSKEDENSSYSAFTYIMDRMKIPGNKLILNVPLFGYQTWLTDEDSYPYGLKGPTNGSNDFPNSSKPMGYNVICSNIKENPKGWKMYWDTKAKVPFAKNSNQWLSFENSKSIFEKASLVLRRGLLGVMVSSIEYDDHEGHCGNVPNPLLRTINFVFNPDQNKPNTTAMDLESWKWILIIVLFCCTAVVISAIYMRKKLKNTGLPYSEIEYFKKGISPKNVDDEQNPDNIPYDASIEIPSTKYSVDKTTILGMGAFGIVFTGNVNDVPVAVKSTKPGADKQYIKSLLSELKICIYIGKHPHIVNLVGANTTGLKRGTLYIFVELCSLGNLQDYLRKSRETFISLLHNDTFYHLPLQNEADNVITTDNLLNWSYQISLALEHLSRKKIIHGDLAARNVLLSEKNVVKVTDFGLSRKLYEYSNYVKKSQEPLPWRWMAIESLRDLTFSVQSDIWSFGVTVWEIFSLGEVPYPGLSWNISFVQNLEQNLRMQKPKYATGSLYNLLLQCWKININERPQPNDLPTHLRKLLEGSSFKDYYLQIAENQQEVAISSVEAESIL